jgi:hypothetical protein
MSQSIMSQLQSRLSTFGLNPKDWIVFSLDTEKFAILAKSSPQVLLAGEIQKGDLGWDWVHLELVEI